MTSPDTHLAALLLTNRLTRVGVPPLRAREFWALVHRADDHGITLGDLLGAGASEHADVADDDVDVGRIGQLLGATRALAFEIERLGEGGINVISALDAEFPGVLRDRLQHGCPPILFVAGPTEWLNCDGLAIVGADDAEQSAHDITRAAVAAAVIAEWTVVTDRTTAIGKTAATEAHACEAHTVAVAAEGINRAARAPAVRKLIQQGQLCVASPYAPDAAASSTSTRARDTVIHALAHTTFVVTAHDGTGSTWGAALEATQREPASVASWLGPGSAAGNRALVDLGARPMQTPADVYALIDSMRCDDGVPAWLLRPGR